MVMGETIENCDIAVIGGGPGGYVAAIRAAQLGKKVILIEKDNVGGVCLNKGCIPSKALIHASSEYHTLKQLSKMGISVGDISLDKAKMIEWKDSVVLKLREGIEFLCKKYGVQIFRGVAKFSNSKKLVYHGKEEINAIQFKKCIIATGSRPRVYKGVEADGQHILHSYHALDLKELPKTMVLVGGGYIGLELGMVYAKLGCHVHVFQRSDTLFAGYEEDVRNELLAGIERLGMTIHYNTKITKVIEKRTEGVDLEIEENGQPSHFFASKVLIAIGRVPNTEDIQLDLTKVELDEHGFIKVDECMQTTDSHIYAIGDVVGNPLLAHKASAQGKVAAEHACKKPVAFDNVVVPAVLFTDPEVATVGLNETLAAQKSIEFIVGKFPFNSLGRALTLDEPRGFVKVVAEKNTKRLIGAQVVGPGASDLISELALAVENGLLLEDVALTIHPHPTLGEAVLEASEDALGSSVHIFRVKK